ncbi:DUF2269 family protein [Methylocystis parvus]|uniref:DUF2269 domain-containing protein n=1 Tax=Methylocystis parvus TaxID=134 RepID=A0A6B8M3J3_9HYPH|nr:DUF2269 domain-containing protein [Methylocystis parvus]QGM98454.1 DUF2269 domain-containing protein [Methylocystis parvus]WBK01209.1 DUF2269 domain-containing protein [Methylocystis parvus OBBP]
MLDVTTLKWIHILSSTVLFGTGLGTAFHGLATNLRGDLRAIAAGNKNVVLADWIFTTPAVILQPLTGVALMIDEGWPYDTPWIVASIALYIFVGCCWLPVVWLQMRMARIADESLASGAPLPPLYKRYFWWWFALGWPAFISMLGIFWLMVAKPQF